MHIRKTLFPTFFALLLSGWPATTATGQVVINEVMPSNTTVLADDDGNFSDWIELFNAGASDRSLSGYSLSDDPDNLKKWTLPDIILPANDYKLIFASGEDRGTGPQQWSTIIDKGHTWHYLTPTGEPPSTWPDPGFDDSGWETGRSGLGFGDSDDATLVDPGGMLAFYVRTTFRIDDLDNISEALLHVDYDDAFVAYLNGTEIARANIGTPGGSRPTINTPADEFIEAFGIQGLAPPVFPLVSPEALLVAGENVLAIQVHNFSSTSSDLSLIPYLSLGFATPVPSAPAVSTILDDLNEFKTGLHTNFKLSANGELLLLMAPDGSIADSITFGPTPTDLSYGRSPDGNAEWGLMATPTPGAPNTDTANPPARLPVFDLPGGHYTGTTFVTISTSEPGATVHYTTDGRIPSQQDPEAPTAGIALSATRAVRARAYLPGALPSQTITQTYLINDDAALPVVSITTDPNNLWDETTGIYVKGPGAQNSFPHFGANFWEDREIPVHFELIEPDGVASFSSDAGAKIFGGWSRGYDQKSLSIFARGSYGNSAFEYPFFPNRPYESYQALVLRNSGNDWNRTHMRDGALQTLIHDTEIDWLAHRPVVVFINGSYWGVQNLREKINEHYAAAVGETDAESVELMEYLNGQGPTAIQGTSTAYEAFTDYLNQTDLTTDEAYAEIVSKVDINNFIDYQLAQIYFDNRDWPGNNNKFWRSMLSEGRWRWILFDTDFGFGIWNPNAYEQNTLAFATEANGPSWPNPDWATFLLRKFLLNQDFEQAFVNRFADLVNGPFDVERIHAVVDSMEANIGPEMERHFNRWGGSYEGWQNNVNVLRTFAANRPEALRAHFKSYFSLGELMPVSVDVNDPVQGDVVVNRLTPDAYPWEGLYYSGTHINIAAKPKPGYRFAHWTGSAPTSAPIVSMDPAISPSLTAVFEPGVAPSAEVRINEIQYNPSPTLDSDAWVELANPTSRTISLENWTFRDGGDDEAYRLPPGAALHPYGFLVLAKNPAAFASIYPGIPYIGGWTFGLSNAGETIRLYDEGGILVDSLTYDDKTPWPTSPDGDGPTLERIDLLTESADPTSWGASKNPGGTPGAINSTSIPLDGTETPRTPNLEAPYPNPFTRFTNLTYTLAAPAHVEIEIYDVLGKRIARLVDQQQSAAHTRSIRWDADSASPGLYFIRLSIDGVHQQTVSALRVN